MTVTRLFSRNS